MRNGKILQKHSTARARAALAAWDRATKAYRFCHDRNVSPFSEALSLALEVYYQAAQEWSAAFDGGADWPEDEAGGGNVLSTLQETPANA